MLPDLGPVLGIGLPTHAVFVALGVLAAAAVFTIEARRRGQTDGLVDICRAARHRFHRHVAMIYQLAVRCPWCVSRTTSTALCVRPGGPSAYPLPSCPGR